MDFFEFFTNHFETLAFIFYTFMFVIGSFSLGYLFGDIHSIRDDLKSLDYDRIVIENEKLKEAIQIKKRR